MIKDIASLQNINCKDRIEDVNELFKSELVPKLKKDCNASFGIIKSVMSRIDLNQNEKQTSLETDEEILWERVLKTHISDTAKDLTIMIKIETYEESLGGQKQLGKNQISVKEKGLLYLVTIGVVDLDFKLYTKLDKYENEWKQHCINFKNYLSKSL